MNVREILETVCAYRAIPMRRMLSGSRTRMTCIARRQICAAARIYTDASYEDIADELALSEPSSVRNAIRRHVVLMNAGDSFYRRDFHAICLQLEDTP